MRTIRKVIALFGVALAGCSSVPHHKDQRDPVVIIYHVKYGCEQELEGLLGRMWDTYVRERMVCSEPHVRVRAHESSGHDRFIETFVWGGPYVTEYPPETVKTLMQKIESLCEPRENEAAVQFRSVQMFVPRIEESIK
jgi:hypothetical protein